MTTPSTSLVRSGRAPALLLLSAATLLLQLVLVRLLSVTLWYHFAFLVVAIALLGYGLAGTALARWPTLRGASGTQRSAIGMVISGVLALLAIAWLPFDPFELSASARQLFTFPVYLISLVGPFLAAGLGIGALVADEPHRAAEMYAWDFAGAALGAAAFPSAVQTLGAERAAVLALLLAAVGGCALRGGMYRRGCFTATGLALLALPFAALWAPAQPGPNKLSPAGVPIRALLQKPSSFFTGWNALARVDVVRDADGYLTLLLDGGTAASRPPAEGIDATLGLALQHSPKRVLVLGSASAYEVAAALSAGAERVDAVEINGLVVEASIAQMGRRARLAYQDPRVHVFIEDGRTFLARSTDRYDLILAAHTISNAAVAAGALGLAESTLLTSEAFDALLAHLTPSGLLYISRPEGQLVRLVASLRAALERRRLEAAPRILTWGPQDGNQRRFFTAALASLSPWSAEALAQARATFEKSGLLALEDGVIPELKTVLHGPALKEALAALPFNAAPTSDDRPFFNQRARWSSLSPEGLLEIFRTGRLARARMEDAPVGEAALLVFFILALLLGVTVGRLSLRGGVGQHRRPLLYFVLLGLAFALVELAVMARFTLPLGHSATAMALTLPGLLAGAGAGAHLSRRWPPRKAALITASILLAMTILPSTWLSSLTALPFVARAAIVVLLCAGTGLGLGMPFPAGLRQLPGQTTPSALALNGVASVIGSIAGVVIPLTAGFQLTLAVAVGLYATAALTWAEPSP